MNPIAQSIGVLRWMRPPQIVASHEKILIPVGTAIRSVVAIIGTRSHGAIPATNMWCAQTEKPRIRIASRDSAISRYPKIGLRLITATISEMIPNPGNSMM